MENTSITSDVFIRDAVTEDLSRIQSLLAAVKLPLEGVKEHLANFLTLFVNGEFIGTVGLEIYLDKALLRSLAVAPDHQGKGFGARLYRTVIEKARGIGISEIYLLTETAEKFFSTMGFEKINRGGVDEQVKTSPEFRYLCPASAVCMRLKLK